MSPSFEIQWREIEMSVRTLLAAPFGSALFTVVLLYGFGDGDPARVAAQIVTGIGFLCAGAILRHELTIKGLTTAVSIWVTAAIALAVGVGKYTLSLLTTVNVLVVL